MNNSCVRKKLLTCNECINNCHAIYEDVAKHFKGMNCLHDIFGKENFYYEGNLK